MIELITRSEFAKKYRVSNGRLEYLLDKYRFGPDFKAPKAEYRKTIEIKYPTRQKSSTYAAFSEWELLEWWYSLPDNANLPKLQGPDIIIDGFNVSMAQRFLFNKPLLIDHAANINH